jgi:hypothetical protein
VPIFFILVSSVNVRWIDEGKATGKDHSIPPWTSFMQSASEYFNAEQVPEGFTLLDPSKMKDPEINELLNFWYERQEDSSDGIGFQFQANTNVQSRKRGRSNSDPPERMIQPEHHPRQPDRSKRSLKAHQSSKPPPGTQKKQKTPATHWTTYIEPDSRRRRKRGTSVTSDGSGESFDFTTVDEMQTSDEFELEYDYEEPASTGKGEHVPIPVPSTSKSTGSTGRPRSLQKKREMMKDNEQKMEVKGKDRKVTFSIDIPVSSTTGEQLAIWWQQPLTCIYIRANTSQPEINQIKYKQW